MESSFLAKISSAALYRITQITLMSEGCDQSLILAGFSAREDK